MKRYKTKNKRRTVKAKGFLKTKFGLIVFALFGIVTMVTIPVVNTYFHTNAKENNIITEYSLPKNNNTPQGITSGPDGNIWFTEYNNDKIGQITTNGKFKEYVLPHQINATNPSYPHGITSGPDGNIWFTEVVGNRIGRITPNGEITEFMLPNSGPNSDLGSSDIAVGPDENMWFTEFSNNKIGRITMEGVITEFSIPSNNSEPQDIVSGPDGNLWFTEFNASKIGRITTIGEITEFIIPINSSYSSSFPIGITSGPDGNLWFTESADNEIGRISTEGVITEFTHSSSNGRPSYITRGSDNNLWFTQIDSDNIGRISQNGEITEFVIPTINSSSVDITNGPDGNIWFTEYGANKIGRVNLANIKEPPGQSKDDAILSPFNKGVTWTVTSGYYNNRNQTESGCHIGLGPDHCRNQLFGLDIVPDQQSDTDVLAPANGKIDYKGRLEGGCLGLRIKLDNGLNMNVCHFATFNVDVGKRVLRGEVLGTRNTSHVHLSLDNRHGKSDLCKDSEVCYLPVPFSGIYTIEGKSFEPDPNGETVILPYPLCDKKQVTCEFRVGFQQYQGLKGTSTNAAL